MKLLFVAIFMLHTSKKKLYSWAHTVKLEHKNSSPERPAVRRNGGIQEILSEGNQ